MIHIITEDNRHLFRHALMEMHRHRKSVFIDRMRWGLEAPQGLEIDQFDAADAVYLVETAAHDGAVTGSVRLLPTARAHLMSEVFSHLCVTGVPRGARIWEVSRFCPAPQIAKGAPRQALLARMIAGIMETGLLFGMERVTFVAGAALAPLAMAIGWDAAPLGPTMRMGRERVRAITAAITPEGLNAVRARNSLTGPMTRFAAAVLPAAA